MIEDEIFRVMYRSAGGNYPTDWRVHTSGKGTSTYGSLGAARGAVTMFKNRGRGWSSQYEYKIQRAPVSAFEDVTE